MADILLASENDFKNMGAATDPARTATGAEGAAPSTDRRGNPDPAAAAVVAPVVGAEGARGFLITLRCTTPNANGSTFVQQNLVKKLLAFTAADAYLKKKPYYIAKATVVSETRVKEDTLRAAAAAGGGAGAGGGAVGGTRNTPPIRGGEIPPTRGERGGRNTGSLPVVPIAPIVPAPGATVDANAPVIQFPDPQTGEEMAEDFALTVRIAVVLDPPPPAVADPAIPEKTRAAAQ